jgi:hypothetical protein
MPKPLLRRAYDNVVLRVLAYYVILLVLGPPLLRALPAEWLSGGAGLVGAFRDFPLLEGRPEGPAPAAAGALGPTVLLAMLGAVACALPVAWVFILTRQKRGYQQSVVQLLVSLPPIVAGVVVLVKFSLALAFSLAGIVAAVRFRNTLDDSKDAVYAFLAIGVGIASGVDLQVAFLLSFVFAMVQLALWFTDFGRTPAHLEGRMAQRRLERALAAASRTGTFVARLDKELFEHMSPEQLEAAARAVRRKQEEGSPAARILRFRARDGAGTRGRVEPLLEARLKEWSYVGSHDDDGTQVVEYTISLRKRDTADALIDDLKKSLPDLDDVTIT